MPKTISLSWELNCLRDAIEAARILAEELHTDHFINTHAERMAPLGIEAVLSLVELRLDDLMRVLRGELDPIHLFAHHNNKPRLEDREGAEKDPYVFFEEWGFDEQETSEEEDKGDG